MNIVGPSRLVLIHSGIYDYGEVELVHPLHLIGPNNVGKTSLIATLQFLYIDDQRHMHFARDMAETRRYYFPDVNSYVLFECLTPTGFQVFGVHGLGPLKQYEIQRFAYQGRFDRADFLDDGRRIREADKIRASLATRNYTLLEPRHLRAALTGIGRDSKDVHLGLLPLQNRNHYGRFRAVFRNLLRLAHLRQEELKAFLIEIHSGDFQQQAIDLEKDYAGQYEKVRHGSRDLRDLQAIAPEARRVVELFHRRTGLRLELPGLWDHLTAVYAKEDARNADDMATLEEHLSTLRENRDATEAERLDAQARIGTMAEKRGALGQKLSDLATQEKEFEAYLPEFEKQRLNLIQDQMDEISSLLKRSHGESPEQIKNRIRKNEQKQKEKQGLLDRVSRAAGARLAKIIDPDRFNTLFNLFNPALLALPMGTEGIEVLDEKGLETRLQSVLHKIQGGVYSDETVRIMLSVMAQQDLAEYIDPDQIRAVIRELDRDLDRDRADLGAAENAEAMKQKLSDLRDDRENRQRRLWQYEQFQENLARSEEWTNAHADLLDQEARLKEQLGELDRLRDRISEQERQAAREIAELNQLRHTRRENIRRLTRPDPDWPKETVSDLPDDLNEIMSRYEEGFREQDRSSKEMASGLQNITSRTYGRFDRETEELTLTALAEELDALHEKEQAVRELWTGLAAGLGNAFKALNRDLDTLKSRVDKLNRDLAKVSVSNLARLRLLVKENPEWVSRIRTIATGEDMPLFTDRSAVDAALEHLGDLLGRYPRVRLMDLFNLHFEVGTPDGTTRTYPHLETIESNGTTITIKVLINLMLLRGLLGNKEISIPFYLDEAASLDHENLVGIVDKARNLGFVPVLASPDALDAADNLYFLKEQKGRVVLEPETSLLRIHREADTMDSSPEKSLIESESESTHGN